MYKNLRFSKSRYNCDYQHAIDAFFYHNMVHFAAKFFLHLLSQIEVKVEPDMASAFPFCMAKCECILFSACLPKPEQPTFHSTDSGHRV